jgi:hypothetical protein
MIGVMYRSISVSVIDFNVHSKIPGRLLGYILEMEPLFQHHMFENSHGKVWFP